jgi:exopolysaccharide production protein ExoQ
MVKQFALLVCLLFILWLFARDHKLRAMTSWALWIPMIWIMLVGSRDVSLWFGAYGHGVLEYGQIYSLEHYAEGTPLDRNIYLLLIIAGVLVLLSRRLNWDRIFATNGWLFAFFAYCAISIVWSDYPFVSFKRWIKDLGNVIMVLIILTEQNPLQALRAIFARYTYLVVPLSLLFIKYFPELGRSYGIWDFQPSFTGVSTNKNGLGAIALICGLFLVWDFIETRTKDNMQTDKTDLVSRLVLILITGWLMHIANSQTSLLCFILGMCIILCARYPFAKNQIRYLGTYGLIIVLLTVIFSAFPSIREVLSNLAGREASLTGRTDLWLSLLSVPINPLIGAGYQNFWQSTGAIRYLETFSFYLNQAHNGYLETYLHLGLVGLSFLVAVIIASGKRLKENILRDDSRETLIFTFFIVAVIYNWTEAMFNKPSLVWMILLIAMLYYPGSSDGVIEEIEENLENNPIKDSIEG